MPLCLTDSREIDYTSLRSNIELVEEQGFPGFVQFGTMGQLYAPSEEEFERVCDVCIEATDSAACVIGSTAPNQRDALRRAAYAEQRGADGTLLAPPYAYPLDEQAAVQFYRDIDAHLNGEMAIMAYNYPTLTGVNLTPDIWSEDLHEIESIKAVKESVFESPQFWESVIVNADHLNFFSGNDNNFYFASMIGAQGFTGVFSWITPAMTLKFYEACVNERHFDPWVRHTYKQMVLAKGKISRIDGARGPALLHELVEIGGGNAGPLRKPYFRLSEESRRALKDAIAPLLEIETDLDESDQPDTSNPPS